MDKRSGMDVLRGNDLDFRPRFSPLSNDGASNKSI